MVSYNIARIAVLFCLVVYASAAIAKTGIELPNVTLGTGEITIIITPNSVATALQTASAYPGVVAASYTTATGALNLFFALTVSLTYSAGTTSFVFNTTVPATLTNSSNTAVVGTPISTVVVFNEAEAAGLAQAAFTAGTANVATYTPGTPIGGTLSLYNYATSDVTTSAGSTTFYARVVLIIVVDVTGPYESQVTLTTINTQYVLTLLTESTATSGVITFDGEDDTLTTRALIGSTTEFTSSLLVYSFFFGVPIIILPISG